MPRKGAQILVDTLLEERVEVMFGIPGGVVIPIFDALYDAPLKLILTRHEQAAAHAADGYARASGRAGVCIATSGPGATNLTTGIATANFDSSPVVAITGQVKTALIGNDAFQEADTIGITRSISKYNCLVRRVEDLARTIKEAFYVATTGRPGPVVIDLPVDVSLAMLDGEPDKTIMLRGYKPPGEGNPKQIRLAADVINAAARPVLYVGGGVIISGASQELYQLAKAMTAPVTTTLMGLGAFPQDDPLSLGMLGMHGTVYANRAIMQADTIVAIGARFDDRVTGRTDRFNPSAKIVHIDIDPSSISKNIKVHVPIVGDAKQVLSELIKHIQPTDRSAWLKQVEDWKKRYPLKYKDHGKLKPQYVIQQISAVSTDDTIICTEVGQNQMWTALWYTFKKPRTLISSGGLGTMGFGLPAAMGAQLARPGALVLDIAGDGSIQMNIQELATVATYNIPVKVAILNNSCLGMVRQWQELFWNKRYSHTIFNHNPDFVKLAEAYGVKGMRITERDQVRDALEEAIRHPGPVIMDFRVDPAENVFPMVPAGKSLDEVMEGLA